MDKTQVRPELSRRDLLKLLATAGIATAGGYALFGYQPWLNYEQPAADVRQPLERNASMSVQMRELIRYATLAANGHNAQQWEFAVKQDAIEIHPDYTRRLPVVDTSDRELWISLENLLWAARATGCAPEVSFFTSANLIHVRLVASTPASGSLFDAIPAAPKHPLII